MKNILVFFLHLIKCDKKRIEIKPDCCILNCLKERNSLRLIRLKIYINFLSFIAAFFNFVYQLSLSFLYLEKITEHDFSTDIFIFHLISQSSSSLVPFNFKKPKICRTEIRIVEILRHCCLIKIAYY
ncbi:hypothetical protein BpHYR1_050716 [Brachionus plicatilis]|uniref:Uncharacterized protein n=1 Tax=Brachionus plicatilis TaxID=10195 RepID=A0A3M7T296_BRAPC|nr:hypothetical protein BpHYR1_050716 [Brachionus plicatilis]